MTTLDQTVLRAEHIQGRGEVAGSANMVWDKDGKWLSNSFDSELQASISNGRLKGSKFLMTSLTI